MPYQDDLKNRDFFDKTDSSPDLSFGKIGSIYKDFEVTKISSLQELQSTLTQLVHIPTGACIIHIGNQDPENLFCLSFQTLPTSSNGVAHILEHTVLCGSKKFPVKDPFFAMTRRSLNTYMNALTGQDFTCYPASSQVEKDFYNLLSVYIDAVFHPELKKVSFLQEGHRLSWNDHHLQFEGIVYNEMKGAMNSIESRLWEELSKRLTPDLTYAHNSGGNPKEIPSLTYEELLEFHKNYYHPSRCLFFFYGNLPLAQHLDFISEQALEGVGKLPPVSPLPLQKRFEEPIQATAHYPIDPEESLENKSVIAFAWLTFPISDQEKTLALSLLDLMLLEHDASPLRMALLKSGLCSQVEASLDLEMSEIPWILVCKGCDPKNKDSLKKVLFTTLEELCKTPFPQELIDASLHQLEFERSEIGGEGIPFGLTLFFRAALLHQHGNDPENGLLIHTLFKQLKERLKDPNYLIHCLRQALLDNPHFVELTLLPDPTLQQKEAEGEKNRLTSIQQTLNDEEIEKIKKQDQNLLSYQEEIENQSLDCLPKITLSDVPTQATDFALTHEKSGLLEVFHHNCFTNQILYANLLFDLPEIENKDLPLLALFTHLISEVGSGGKSYAETLALQQAYTGELDAFLSLHVLEENPHLCKPSFNIKGKSLYRNSEKLFSLMNQMAATPDFTDLPRMKELLVQHATELRTQLTRHAMTYAIQLSFSGQSIPSHIYNQWHGLPYYEAVLKWAETCDEELLENLQRIHKIVIASPKPHLIVSCDEKEMERLKKQSFYHLTDSIPTQSTPSWKGNYPLLETASHARLIASPVAFTAYGIHTISYCDEEAPFLYLAKELLENCVLHKEIREKGGAYGGGASYSASSGNFHLYAYRDPKLAKTETIFHQAIEKISRGHFGEQDLEEAKLGSLQNLDAPVPPGTRAIVAYAWMRAGRSFAKRDAFRKKILQATKEDVMRAVQEKLLSQKGILVSFLGKELFEKETKKRAHPLPLLPIAL